MFFMFVFFFVNKGRDYICFFFSSRRRHTRLQGDWSSDVCSSDLGEAVEARIDEVRPRPLVESAAQAVLGAEKGSLQVVFVEGRRAPDAIGRRRIEDHAVLRR